MEASHKTHRPHIKVGKDEEEEEEDVNFITPFITPFGLRSGVKPSIRYLHWSVRTRGSLMKAMSVILTLVLLDK